MIKKLNLSILARRHFFTVSLALIVSQLSQPLTAHAQEMINSGVNTVIPKSEYKTLAEEKLNENANISSEKKTYFYCHEGHEHDLTTHILVNVRNDKVVLKENLDNVAIHRKISMQQNRKIPSNKKIQIRLSEMEPRTHQSHIRVLF